MSTLLFAVSLGEESIVPTLKLNRMKFAEESRKDLWPIRQTGYDRVLQRNRTRAIYTYVKDLLRGIGLQDNGG